VTVLLVALGGAAGAPARYLLDKAITARQSSQFPWGTFVVNMLGCLALGVLAGPTLAGHVFALLGTGFCGAFTTYSTFAYEAVALAERRAVRSSAAYTLGSVAGGLMLAAAGYALTS
jgi:CrcB protein